MANCFIFRYYSLPSANYLNLRVVMVINAKDPDRDVLRGYVSIPRRIVSLSTDDQQQIDKENVPDTLTGIWLSYRLTKT
jgi:hypothetical protein